MGDFEVRPATIAGYQKILDKQAGDVTSAETYVRENTELSGGGGLLEDLLGTHKQVVQDVNSLLSRTHEVLYDSSVELGKTAEFYRGTDKAEAERLDRAYRQVDSVRDAREDYWKDGEIFESEDPVEDLKEVAEPKEPKGNAIQEAKKFISTYISPMAALNEVINMAGIKGNPAQDFADKVAGDWKSFEKCATVWDNLGDFYISVGGNVTTGNSQLSDVWKGNAADAAYNYFHTLGGKLSDDIADSLRKLSKEYKVAAAGVSATADEISGLIRGLYDDMVWISIAAAGGTASSSTLVGPAVGGGVVLFKIYQLVEKWNKLNVLSDKLDRLVRRFTAGAGAAVQGTVSLEHVKLPKAYDHPGAK